MTQTFSRREFLIASAVTLSATVVAGCTAQPSDTSSAAAQTSDTDIETPSFVYGNETTMESKILLVYATRTGSTVDVASAIGETLAGRGFFVDVKPVKENPSPDGYGTVILGSAINGAQWLPEAVQYVKDNQQVLNQAKVALFCVHCMNLGDDEKSKKNRLAYLNTVRSLIQSTNEAFFAGMGMKPEETPALVRWVYRTFKLGGEGDCRDWDKIRGWAQSVQL